jgi:hypothetical protein
MVDVATSSSTHARPAAHGATPVKHAAILIPYAAHVPDVAPLGVAQFRSRPQSAFT